MSLRVYFCWWIWSYNSGLYFMPSSSGFIFDQSPSLVNVTQLGALYAGQDTSSLWPTYTNAEWIHLWVSLFQLDLQSFPQWWGEGISVIPVRALGSIPLLLRGSLPSLRWTPVHWSLPCLRPRGALPATLRLCHAEALSSLALTWGTPAALVSWTTSSTLSV